MDIITIKELLEEQFGHIFNFHPKFFEEYCELVTGSGEESKVTKLLVRRLIAIKELGNRDYGFRWLEHLKKYGNMYSLHIDTNTQNYRLLFSKDSNKKFFLHMFYEKEGKRATSYVAHVPIAARRRDNEE